MTAEQAAALKRLTLVTYELDAFKPNLTRTEADIRIAMLTAKLSKGCFDQAGFRFCSQAPSKSSTETHDDNYRIEKFGFPCLRMV